MTSKRSNLLPQKGKRPKSLPSQKNPTTGSLIVTQANRLIEARYNLSVGEQRLILAMISKIQPDDEDFKPYHVSISDLAEFMGLTKNSMYQECQRITKSLLERVLEINEPTGLLQIGWVSSAKYIDGKGMVKLAFDPLLKPYLLQLKGNFTSCRFEMLLSFKSQYTIRLYNLCKQYELIKTREFELDVLRKILGIGEGQYTLYGNFKISILEATRRELEEKADLYFEYDEIKYGRAVGAIRFHIKSKDLPDEKALLPDDNADLTDDPFESVLSRNRELNQSSLLALIPAPHRKKKTVITAITGYEKKYGIDYVKRNILYANSKAAKSYAGFLAGSLKADWGHDWEIDQNIKISQPPVDAWKRQGFASQREYDEHMFKKQMETYKRKEV
jgi:Initiator Replication protein